MKWVAAFFGLCLCLAVIDLAGPSSVLKRTFSHEKAPEKPGGLDPLTHKPLVTCPTCGGRGDVYCEERNCFKGQVKCPGKCLKLTDPGWEPMNVAGHGANELWKKYPYLGGMQAWNQNHIGEVIEMRDGIPTNVGKCPICGGATSIPCKVCQGTGRAPCPTCKGRGVVAEGVKPAAPTVTPKPR